MQIILLEKVKNLGELGELVNVKPGFARNFLIPGGRAVPATSKNIEDFESRRADLEKQQAEIVAAAEARAEQLEGLTITLSRRAGDAGRLFGSVGPADVSEAITATGVEIAKHEIRMPGESIRQTGEYEIGVHLHADVGATVMLVVEADA